MYTKIFLAIPKIYKDSNRPAIFVNTKPNPKQKDWILNEIKHMFTIT